MSGDNSRANGINPLIQQPPSGLKASPSRQVTVTDVERPSLPQSASQGVLNIVTDNPVNSLQAVWMPRPRPVLARTHWFLLRSLLFSSPTPRATRVIPSGSFTSRLMVQERRVLAPPSCGEKVSNVYLCSSLTFSLTYKFSCCFSCCLGSVCGHCHDH